MFRNRTALLVVISLVAVMGVGIDLQAQQYPMPSAVGQTPTYFDPELKAATSNPVKGVPTWQYTLPLKAFKGRYLDASKTRDYQAGWGYRTLRAKSAVLVPERNRAYFMLGETLAAYNLDTFMSSKLGSPLKTLPYGMAEAGISREQYLPWDAAVYAEDPSSGWIVEAGDGQQRLYDFDYDDRGFLYLAYSFFGWGVVQDTGNGLGLVKQMLDTTPTRIATVKADSGKYYSVVEAAGEAVVYDVTNASNPSQLRRIASGSLVAMKRTTGSSPWLAMNNGQSIKIYSADGLTRGVPDGQIAEPATYRGLGTDGTRFYAIKKTSNSLSEIITIGRSTGTWQIEGRKTLLPVMATPTGLNYSEGYVTVWGKESDGGYDLRLYKAEGSGLTLVDLQGFFKKYYAMAPVGYAQPVGYTNFIQDAIVFKQNGRSYLFFSGYGIGDVFELQAGDTIDVSVSSNWGTPNPYSETANGPYYGDPMTFYASSTGTQQFTVNWNFGNPESASNVAQTITPGSVTHQYSGLASASAITATKTVTASSASDANVAANASVNLLAPVARMRIANTDLLFLQANASSPAPIVFGDSWADASDGSVEGHTSKWTVNGTSTSLAPNQPLPVGPCGLGSASLIADYMNSFKPSVGTVNYTVRPFVPVIEIKNSNPSTVTFRNATRVSAGAVASGGSWTAVWRLVNVAGADVLTETDTSAAGTADEFIVSKAQITPGSKIVLTITIDPGSITEASCASANVAGAEFALNVPDPQIVKTGCEYTNSPCKFTASSVSGSSTSDWTYEWTVDGAIVSGVTTNTYTRTGNWPNAGSYTVAVRASNLVGTGNLAATTVTIAEPIGCTVPPGSNADFSISCGTGCTAGQTITFSYSNWGYVPQECDQYSWTFGDGSTSTVMIPKKAYAANGTYTVVLKVSNEAGTVTKSKSVTIGGGTTPPPPPPPPPPTCSSAPGAFPSFTTSCTSCSVNQSITFNYSNWGYTPQSCDTYSWNFGDGSSSTLQRPTKSYAAAGTYNVSLTVTNTYGTVSTSKDVVIGGGTTPPPTGSCSVAPSGSIGLTWSAPSGCTPGSNCRTEEEISFIGSVFGYTAQSCDTWEWSFGDGAKATGQTAKHKYTSGGSFTVVLKIKNAVGEKSAERNMVVANLNVAPPAGVNFTTSTTNPIVGKEITFTGQATTPDGHPVTSWKWTFGDGGTATGNPVTHTYSTAGPWNVSLVASNAGGTAPTLTREVKVAAQNSYAFLLPVVTHGAGHNGSLWRTDLQIYYPYEGEEVELEFEIRSATLAATKIMRLDRSTLIAEDFMSFFTDGDNSGPVIVRGNTEKLPQIWTRTYNVAANGIGTFGQLIPAVRLDTNENSATGPTSYYLPGVRLTDRYRTNIGLLNISGSPMTVTLTAFEDSFGAAIGQFHQTLDPYRFIQIGDGTLRTNFAGYPTDKAFSVMISGADEGDLIAYESMIDNVSNDPVYVSAVPASLASDPGMKNQIVPGVGHFQSWKSDISIFNPDDQAVQFDLTFYDEKGRLLSEAQNRILPAKGTLQINDIVNAPEMTPVVGKDVIGTLRLDVDSPLADQFPVVTDRTYNDQGAAGTYGQGIIGVPISRPNVQVGKPAILPAVRQDLSYYTNLGLVNVGDEPSTVLVSLLDKQSGQPIGTWSATLTPGESIVASRILQAINATADNGSLKIEVTSGAPVWAYASVIDQMTKDPEYVPAVPLD